MGRKAAGPHLLAEKRVRHMGARVRPRAICNQELGDEIRMTGGSTDRWQEKQEHRHLSPHGCPRTLHTGTFLGGLKQQKFIVSPLWRPEF
jgi:hypothetical protein